MDHSKYLPTCLFYCYLLMESQIEFKTFITEAVVPVILVFISSYIYNVVIRQVIIYEVLPVVPVVLDRNNTLHKISSTILK